jgi:hypothetical protein
MALDENTAIQAQIERIRRLIGEDRGSIEYFEVASLAQSVLHDTVGGNHPLMAALDGALKSTDWMRAVAASRSVVALYEEGGLRSPRMAIAHKIEADILDITQQQVEASGKSIDAMHKRLQLAIAAFLAGAALEVALRRLCDTCGVVYDPQRTSISKLQGALFQPSR